MPIRWTRRDGELVLDIRENPFHYILAAIRLTEKYAREKNILLSFYDLKVTSELDSSNGRKYGLGSSGAVTVATVKALNMFYALNLTQIEIFKIAALANLTVQDNGSCGDIAASCYGGWIAFSTFDHQWLQEQEKQHTIVVAYQKFLQDSTLCVHEMIKGFKENNIDLIQAMIRKNRQLLHELSSITGVLIETPALNKLCSLAEEYEGAAKSSGAGGGDCGIVIVDQKSGILPLMSAWELAEITPLPLHVYSNQRKEKG